MSLVSGGDPLRCPSCGNENPTRAPQCAWCGLLFEVVVPPRADPSRIWQPPPPPVSPPPRARPVSTRLLGLLLLLSGSLLGLSWILRGPGEPPVSAPRISPSPAGVPEPADSPETGSTPPEPLTEEALYTLIGEIDRIAEFGVPDDLRPWIDERVQFQADLIGSGGHHALGEGRVGLVAHWMGRRVTEGAVGVRMEESTTIESVEVAEGGAFGEIVRTGRSTMEIDGLAVSQIDPPAAAEGGETVLKRTSLRCAYRERIRVGREGERARVVAVRLIGSCARGA